MKFDFIYANSCENQAATLPATSELPGVLPSQASVLLMISKLKY